MPTVVLDVNRIQAAFSSKYATGILCPHPKYHEEEYIDFLLRLGEWLPQKGVLFPTGDTETLAILKHRTRLEKYYHFTMADYDRVNSLINKQQFYHLLGKYDICHPLTFFPRDEDEATVAGKQLSYPCIVKPVYPTYFRLDFHTKLFIACSSKEMISFYRKASEKHHQMMLQEIIPGGAEAMFGYNAYVDTTGVPHGRFMYQRIREWPLGSGNGCYIQSVQQPFLGDITDFLMKNIGYFGIVDAEFKYDTRDNRMKCIEVNPRIWMQNSFPSRYGCNLPYLAYLDALGEDFPKIPSNSSQKNINWVYFFEDIQSARQHVRTRSLSIARWIRAYSFRNEHAIFAWDDPFPFFLYGFRSISPLFSRLFRKSDSRI
ncbi:MAG: hypothetical protein JW840_04490 [Candidatus Thermoplasmatota archaeon]|nr:hypothetical protein [Candidatus Thermoplasmatota archaeon]